MLGIAIEQRWWIGEADMACTRAAITNSEEGKLVLERLSALSLPVPRRFDRLVSFAGRWAGEMRDHTQAIAPDGFSRASSAGKPGLSGGNWMILEDQGTGEVLGAHLAWSGDYDTRIDCDMMGSADGRAVLQMAAVWGGGEVDLGFDPAHTTPTAMFALAPDRSALARRFHDHARAAVLPSRKDWGPRKVHLNSWEALGFGLSEPKLMALADSAAALGVERFVLDDGWFSARRNDRSSLGDWTVAPDVFPDGLGPLIGHVKALGMDFGLWVEPEMVSPDSDFYRKQPLGCLYAKDRDRQTMRGQLVLDLLNPVIFDAVFDQIDTLLREYDIAYLKWDHNRDLFPAKTRVGSVRRHQTDRLYQLLDRLRRAHPQVEIESCASGGGRIDYGILGRVHRVWPSDNNDPIERARIMRAWSQFLPLEVLGNHVGPSPNPITGRLTSMDFRAKVALFGHMGVEADPGAMSEHERKVLAEHIAFYKHWRTVLHAGDWYGLDHPDPGIFAQMVVHGGKALALAAQTCFSATFDTAPLRLAGLEAGATYRVTLPRPWPGKAALYLPDWQAWETGLTLSGRALMTQGLALPLTHPETAWAIALERLPA